MSEIHVTSSAFARVNEQSFPRFAQIKMTIAVRSARSSSNDALYQNKAYISTTIRVEQGSFPSYTQVSVPVGAAVWP